ncbi:MAG: sulfotransferase family protein [Myxococcota bacterium]
MTLQVVGAGLFRTGTMSLKAALERLLGRSSYHMAEVFVHPEHVPIWHSAALGEMPNWAEFLKEYCATVDAPAAYFWPELSEAFPDAIVLLSVRSADSWCESASQTVLRTEGMVSPEWDAMNEAISSTRFATSKDDRESAIQGFNLHNARVREAVEPRRLVEWRDGDGWEPICAALGVSVPDEPFPHTNTREEWRARERAR